MSCALFSTCLLFLSPLSLIKFYKLLTCSFNVSISPISFFFSIYSITSIYSVFFLSISTYYNLLFSCEILAYNVLILFYSFYIYLLLFLSFYIHTFFSCPDSAALLFNYLTLSSLFSLCKVMFCTFVSSFLIYSSFSPIIFSKFSILRSFSEIFFRSLSIWTKLS